jgi:hypothetical protein
MASLDIATHELIILLSLSDIFVAGAAKTVGTAAAVRIKVARLKAAVVDGFI